MARYFIRLSYCGTNYNGWQSQPHIGTTCVQSTIEKCMSLFLRETIEIVGCGRTDTGVHAMDYYAHFDTDVLIDTTALTYRLNKMLPMDISIHSIHHVDGSSHARFDATSRSYQYHLHTQKTPFSPLSYFYYYDEPNINILNEAAALLLNYTDFTAFCKLHTDVMTKNCILKESRWVKEGNHYTYYITADRFLRGMIRLIVGMCLNVARGKITLDEVKDALVNQRPLDQNWSVPAIGLFLYGIEYPEKIIQ